MLLHLAIQFVAMLGHQREDRIPVIGYHEIGGPPEFPGGPRYDIHGLNISVETFRRQLEMMWSHGFRPFSVRDLVEKRLLLPKSERPVVLSFDDGRPTQYRILPDGSIDPNCAVGVMLAFHRTHPDWPLRGTFYIIAGSDQNGVPFDQEGLERKKIRQLLDWGFEIGNHSLTHPSFKILTTAQIKREVGGCDLYLKQLIPGIQVDTMALPYGDLPNSPKGEHQLRGGFFHHHPYRNIGVVLFSGSLCPPPDSQAFDPYRIPRIAPEPGKIESLVQSAN